MSELIVLVEEAAEGGFNARAISHSIFSEADTLDELRQNIREAVDRHFEDGQTPKITRLHTLCVRRSSRHEAAA